MIHEELGGIYVHLELEVGLRDLDKSFQISYLYIENFCTLLSIQLKKKKKKENNKNKRQEVPTICIASRYQD